MTQDQGNRVTIGLHSTADGKVQWPSEGAGITYAVRQYPSGRWGNSPTYHRPTLISLHSDKPQSTIADRSDTRVAFTLGPVGEGAWYEGVISQDDMFRVLYDAGLLTRREDDRW